jgi:hypothetical protein
MITAIFKNRRERVRLSVSCGHLKVREKRRSRRLFDPAAKRRHEKARHGSAGDIEVEPIESALADGTVFVTAS